ncbi:hypothetical protein [Microbaculum marinisediminis]|uniref:NnrU protein n=1 Tax=Microbaculum marinisediminis TaxID=2931392 RepID=A0AAW5R4K0_9HYPH|nr:hypothetical protein [Microbaculum sp. A6E488]MCT8973549.1 hypothetical protein [Microbaculum sp. A6E488]
MGKTVAILLGLAMIVHLIRPLGLPGLRKRSDAWKIAVFALFAMVVLVGIRPS